MYAILAVIAFLILLLAIAIVYYYRRKAVLPVQNEAMRNYCVDISNRLNDDIHLQRLLVIETVSNFERRDQTIVRIARNNTLLAQDLSYFLPAPVKDKVLSILHDKTMVLEQLYTTLIEAKKVGEDMDKIIAERFEIMRSYNVKLISLLIDNDTSRSAVSYDNLRRAFNERDLIILVQGKEVIQGHYDKSIDVLSNLQVPSQQITTILYQYCQAVPLK
jgi:hypothetical protein